MASSSNTTRTKRLRGRAGVKQRERRLARSDGLCQHCLVAEPKRIRIATVVNHIKPLAHGGSDEDGNTENLCRECDLIETARVFGYKQPKRETGADGWPK